MREEALFINGVFEGVLSEIVEVQEHLPEQVLFLQPHSAQAIRALRENPPSVDEPMRLYISLTSELATVAYQAEIVGWDSKPDLSEDKRHLVARIQAMFQPGETSMLFESDMVNLLHVRRMQELENPFSVSRLIKVSNDEPYSESRATSGGWSVVRLSH